MDSLLRQVHQLALVNPGHDPDINGLRHAWSTRRLGIILFANKYRDPNAIVSAIAPNAAAVHVEYRPDMGKNALQYAANWIARQLEGTGRTRINTTLAIVGSPLAVMPILQAACEARGMGREDTDVRRTHLLCRGGILVDRSGIELVHMPTMLVDPHVIPLHPGH